MKPITDLLLELQTLMLSPAPTPMKSVERVKQIRKEVPESLLAHFDRLMKRNRRAVAVVTHGVCGGCHMRLPSGVSASLLGNNDVQLCETCSSFILLAPEELIEQRKLAEDLRARRLQKMHRALALVDQP